MIGWNENAHFHKTRFPCKSFIQSLLRYFVAMKTSITHVIRYTRNQEEKMKTRFQVCAVFPLLFCGVLVPCFHSTVIGENLSHTPPLLSHQLKISPAFSGLMLGKYSSIDRQSLSTGLCLKYFVFYFKVNNKSLVHLIRNTIYIYFINSILVGTLIKAGLLKPIL